MVSSPLPPAGRRLFGLLSLCLVLLLAACRSDADRVEPADPAVAEVETVAPDAPLLALHLLQLASDAEAVDLANRLDAFNTVVAEAGHPEVRYSVWRNTGERDTTYSHVFGSVWPDRATYDRVHGLEAYQTLMQEQMDELESITENDTYGRYTFVRAPGAPDLSPPSTAPDAPRFAALHLIDLADGVTAVDFADTLETLNEAVVEAGHPETRYLVWENTGERDTTHDHVFFSVWADRPTYDAVHAHDAWQSAADAMGPPEAFVADDTYLRLEEILPE